MKVSCITLCTTTQVTERTWTKPLLNYSFKMLFGQESSTTSALAVMSISALSEEKMLKCSAIMKNLTNSRHCVPPLLDPRLGTSNVERRMFCPQPSLLTKLQIKQRAKPSKTNLCNCTLASKSFTTCGNVRKRLVTETYCLWLLHVGNK